MVRKIADSLLQVIGNTPVAHLNKVMWDWVKILPIVNICSKMVISLMHCQKTALLQADR